MVQRQAGTILVGFNMTTIVSSQSRGFGIVSGAILTLQLSSPAATAFTDMHSSTGLELPCGTPFRREGYSNCNEVCRIDSTGPWALHNVFDFVGQDSIAQGFFENGYFLSVFVVLICIVLGLFTLFFCFNAMLRRRWKPYASLNEMQKFRFVFDCISVVVLVATAIPYTFFACKLLFSPDFVGAILHDYALLFFFIMSHAALYIVEGCARLPFRSPPRDPETGIQVGSLSLTA
jgi:hypothetical protein